MNFFIGIFQGFWLQISEHLFSRTALKWLLLQRRIQDLVKMELFCEYNDRLKAVNYFHKKAPTQMFHKFLWLQVLFIKRTSSKFIITRFEGIAMYLMSFFLRIKETLCPLSNVTLSKYLELLCDCMSNTKTIIYIT